MTGYSVTMMKCKYCGVITYQSTGIAPGNSIHYKCNVCSNGITSMICSACDGTGQLKCDDCQGTGTVQESHDCTHGVEPEHPHYYCLSHENVISQYH